MTLFTDEEILEEFKKHGHRDITPEKFRMMKEDLIKLASSETNFHENSNENFLSSSNMENDKISRTPCRDAVIKRVFQNVNSKKITTHSNTKRILCRKTLNAEKWDPKPNASVNNSQNDHSSLPYIAEKLSEVSINKKLQKTHIGLANDTFSTVTPIRKWKSVSNWVLSNKPQQQDLDLESIVLSNNDLVKGDDSSTIHTPNEKSHTSKQTMEDIVQESESKENVEIRSLPDTYNAKNNVFMSKYKKNWKNYKSGYKKTLESDYSTTPVTELESSHGSVSFDGKFKRKVLRLKNGKPTLTEELVDIPYMLNSSYPQTSVNSFDNSSQSFKFNNSTGNISALSPDSLTPRSTVSLSTSSHMSNLPRKKKNDPVAMYNYYKRFWESFKPPGEKNHDKLRWAVRDKMLDYHL